MPSTLSLKTSQKLYELLGECETEKCWHNEKLKHGAFTVGMDDLVYPAPSFQELIRLLPRIGEKKEWPLFLPDYGVPSINGYGMVLLGLYMHAQNESEAMEAVDEYLAKLL